MCTVYTFFKLSNFYKVISSPSFPESPLVVQMIGFRVTISLSLIFLLFSLTKESD